MNNELKNKLTIDDCENCPVIEGYDDCILGFCNTDNEKKIIYSYSKMLEKTKKEYIDKAELKDNEIERQAVIYLDNELSFIGNYNPIVMYDFTLDD